MCVQSNDTSKEPAGTRSVFSHFPFSTLRRNEKLRRLRIEQLKIFLAAAAAAAVHAGARESCYILRTVRRTMIATK